MNTYIERPIGIPINFPIVPADEIRSNYGCVCPFLSPKKAPVSNIIQNSKRFEGYMPRSALKGALHFLISWMPGDGVECR
jgi:hypothetical protein